MKRRKAILPPRSYIKKTRVLTLLMLLGLLLLLPGFLFAQEDNNEAEPLKFALVIGNSKYSGLTPLTNPVNDANDIAAVLEHLGFSVDKVLDGDLVKMEEAVERLRETLMSAENAYGFFFYAGHGVQSGNENYLIPVDANIPNENYLRTRAVSVQAVLDDLNDARNALNVVVLDACRDNPFGWSRSGTRGLAIVGRQPSDSIIVYATSAGQRASDGDGRNGLFTSMLLPNLAAPGLEVKEVFNRTGLDVSEASGGQQIPAIYNQFFKTAYLGTTPENAATALPFEFGRISPNAPKPKRDMAVFALDGKRVFSFSVMPSANLSTLSGKGGGIGLSFAFYEKYGNYGDFFYIPNSFFASAFYFKDSRNIKPSMGIEMSIDPGEAEFAGFILSLGALYKMRLDKNQRLIVNFGPSIDFFTITSNLYWDDSKYMDKRSAINTYNTIFSPGIGFSGGLGFRISPLVSMDLGLYFKMPLLGRDLEVKVIGDYGRVYEDNFAEGFRPYTMGASLGLSFWFPR